MFVCDVCVCVLCFWLHVFCQASEEQSSSKDGKGNTQYQQSKGAAKTAAEKKDKKGKGKVNKKDKKGKGKGNMCALM